MKKIYSFCILTILFSGLVVAQAPQLIQDINDGSSGSNPRNLFVFNGSLYFSADDSSGVNSGGTDTGAEVWITDGTATGTSIVSDINPGDGDGSNPFAFFELNGNLYFNANAGSSELWTTDGTAAGTTLVDLFPSVAGDVPNNPVVLNGVVYLTVNLPDGNNQLAEWDGTNAAQVVPNAANNGATILATSLVVYNNLIFGYIETSIDEPTIGRELYSYDPTTDTFTLIANIGAGANNSGISNFTVANNLLYFESGNNLWQTDGTTAGTIEVVAAAGLGIGGVSSLFNFNENLLFEGDINGTDQLFLLNTTNGDIAQLSANASQDHNPGDYAVVGSNVYYSGSNDSGSLKFLFRTDGAGVEQMDNTIKDIDDIVVFNNILYFEGEDLNANLGNELYSFNPATASIAAVTTNSVKVFPNPSSGGSITFTGLNNPNESYVINDLSGRQVLTGQLNNSQLNHSLSTGMYFITIETNTQTIKFIVE